MTRYMIYPYTQGSAGAKVIAEELGGKRILIEGSSYSPRQGDVIINWGSSSCPFPTALNRENKAVLNKGRFFERLKGTGLTPASCTTKTAAALLQFPVFCRQRLEGRDGQGIVIATDASQLVEAKLYVESVPKTSEYRIHVGRLPSGDVTVIGSQKKIVGQAQVASGIWTGDGTNLVWTVNGQPAFIPPAVRDVVSKAFDKFPELTFGAFDAVYCSGTGEAYVLEINSAPLVTPETARRYGAFFRVLAQANAPSPSLAAEVQQAIAPEPQPVSSEPVAPEPQPVLLTISVPQKSVTMVQNILAAVGVNIQ